VAAWKLAEDNDVKSTIRASLLQMRQLTVNNIVLMTSHNITDILLDTVRKLDERTPQIEL